MKFSIVVPIYNISKYLQKCVGSFMEQTYQNIEIVLVDDGSTDESGKLCDKYRDKDKRIKVIHKTNGGLVTARQAGVQGATGDYVVCVDGDDWISIDYIETFAKIAELYRPDIIMCGLTRVEQGKSIEIKPGYRKGFYTRQQIENEIFPSLIQTASAGYFAPSLCSKAIKRELYEEQQLLVNPKIKIGEDGACTIPCVYYSNSLYVLHECMYYYRNNISSMTKSKQKSFDWNGPLMIHEHLQERIDLREFGFQQQLYRKTTHELFLVIVSQFYRDESYHEIIRDIKEHLKVPVYAEAIEKSSFSGSVKAFLMKFALKYKWIWLLWIYSKL